MIGRRCLDASEVGQFVVFHSAKVMSFRGAKDDKQAN